MEEKVLIKSEQYDVKKIVKILIIIGAIISLCMFLDTISDYMHWYDSAQETYLVHQENGKCGSPYDDGEKCYDCEIIEEYSTKFGYVFCEVFQFGETSMINLIPVVAAFLLGGLAYLWLRSYELTVTDKRVYGKVAFGKRVDLPVDSVSAIATIRLLKGVSVSTSSGRISFIVIKNSDEIYKSMNDLLIKRQEEKAKTIVDTSVLQNDVADQLKKYKDLLDSGVITQEEFETKKKQLLSL